MAIRRISELPAVSTINSNACLSDYLFEVSLDDGNNRYHSAYIKGAALGQTIINEISETTIENITITSALTLNDADFYINGGSILAWPNESDSETSCLLHFDVIKLSAENELALDGPCVVINHNLSVYPNCIML